MSEIDLVILCGIALSAAMSFFRGMFREALSLLVWIGAIVITLFYSSRFASLLPIDSVQSPLARASISGVVLFIGTLFVGGTLKWFITHILTSSKLGVADRLGGVVFGSVRGMLIVALLVLAANLVPELKSENWWQRSSLLPRFQTMAEFIHARLPLSVAQHFDINRNGT